MTIFSFNFSFGKLLANHENITIWQPLYFVDSRNLSFDWDGMLIKDSCPRLLLLFPSSEVSHFQCWNIYSLPADLCMHVRVLKESVVFLHSFFAAYRNVFYVFSATSVSVLMTFEGLRLAYCGLGKSAVKWLLSSRPFTL